MKTDRNALTETEEMLLEKFFDNETSFFERLSAKRLLARDPAAKRYFASLQSAQSAIAQALPLQNPSLWFRISARLHAEEKGALLLGKRELRQDNAIFGLPLPPLFSRFFVRGGFAVALTAAAVFVVIPKTQQQPAGQVATAAPSQINIQRGIPMAVPASVGVDWMRSDGRLQVMHEPSDRAPMIFVKRRFNRVGPVIKTESNSQGIIMREGGFSPQGLPVSSGR